MSKITRIGDILNGGEVERESTEVSFTADQLREMNAYLASKRMTLTVDEEPMDPMTAGESQWRRELARLDACKRGECRGYKTGYMTLEEIRSIPASAVGAQSLFDAGAKPQDSVVAIYGAAYRLWLRKDGGEAWSHIGDLPT